MEYINKAELKAKIDALHPSVYDETPEWNDGYYSAMNDIMAEATVLPTIDIVRCKDCKYCKIEDWDGDNYRVCTRDQHIRSGSWFCADGQKK